MPFNEVLFLDNIGKIIVFLMLMMTVFLLTAKSKKRLPNFIFAAFLIVTAFDMLGLFISSAIFEENHLFTFKVVSSFLQMPLFYFYVRSVCYTDFSFKWIDLLHSIPFVLFLVIFSQNLMIDSSWSLKNIVGEIQYFAYIAAIFLTLQRHKRVYLENFSNPDYTAYKWLFQATLLFCIAHSLVIIRMLLEFAQVQNQWLSSINVIISISALSVTCWLVMKAMYQPKIFMGTLMNKEPINDESIVPKLELNDQEVIRLKSFMETQKPYLDYELSLKKLASLYSMNEKELSLLINQKVGKHFFDFINEYRINDAKAILENPRKSDLTIQEILYKVGFNSKSSFYTSFKKETGVTPIKYRNSIG